MAVEVETGRFTVGVFQDIAWAEKGVEALRKQGLAVESLSILGKASPEMARVHRAHARRAAVARRPRSRPGGGARAARRRAAGQRSGLEQDRHRRHDAARRIPGARRPHLSRADRPGRRARGDSQRAAGRRRARGAALVRWRKCRNWSLDRTGLAEGSGSQSSSVAFRRVSSASKNVNRTGTGPGGSVLHLAPVQDEGAE